MCCFSGRVTSVGGTKTFARRGVTGTQLLAYRMQVDAPHELAMILPLPASDVQFLDLSDYPELFEHLERGFPQPKSWSLSRGGIPVQAAAHLPVHRVGSFIASFVPTMADFSRLDPRFRIADDVWPERYADFAFAVFQLADVAGGASIEPMGLSFSSRQPRLFFPTFHIHDGTAPLEADFDHVLYAQQRVAPRGWETSVSDAREFVDPLRCGHLVDGNRPVFRQELLGTQANRDVVV